ncbi:MAG: hypothetical protein AAGL34_04055 [Bacteroidota bacterium]
MISNRGVIDSWFKTYPLLLYTFFINKDNKEKLVAGFNRKGNKDEVEKQVQQFKKAVSKDFGEPDVYRIDGVRNIPLDRSFVNNEIDDKIRPASSITRNSSSRGTVGGILNNYLFDDGNPFLLTCEHVLKNSKSGDKIRVRLNNQDEVVAKFYRGVNNEYLDFAIAEIDNEYLQKIAYTTKQGYRINFNDPTAANSVAHQKVRFTDRNGDLSPAAIIVSTEGTIKMTTTGKLYYNQIVLSKKISYPGDSGAVPILMDENTLRQDNSNMVPLEAMGLIFAEGYLEDEVQEGSNGLNGEHTFMNPISVIIDEIKKELE